MNDYKSITEQLAHRVLRSLNMGVIDVDAALNGLQIDAEALDSELARKTIGIAREPTVWITERCVSVIGFAKLLTARR